MQVQSSADPPKKLDLGERAVMADGNEYNIFQMKEAGRPVAPVYATEGSPLIIGVGKDEYVVASDASMSVGGAAGGVPSARVGPGPDGTSSTAARAATTRLLTGDSRRASIFMISSSQSMKSWQILRRGPRRRQRLLSRRQGSGEEAADKEEYRTDANH